jgi:thiamine-monophosphate kinase
MKESLRGLGEFGLIRALTADLKSGGSVQHGIGDDCAVVEFGGKSMLLTCDASLEGVHFRRDWGTPEDIGWKAAVSAISDIAAMGGRASFMLVTLALPADAALDYVEALYGGIKAAVDHAGVLIVGGDTTASNAGIVLDFTVVGEVVGRPMLRRGAQPGDVIAMTGTIGERGAGLHALLHGVEARDLVRAYLHPFPRMAEGQWLQAQPGVKAMMDVSDGLVPDARHIAKASGVGIDLRRDWLPANTALEDFWRGQALDCAAQRLRSGEEYELLVVLKADEAEGICEAFAREHALPMTVVGLCGGGHEGVWVDGAETDEQGFEHFLTP